MKNFFIIGDSLACPRPWDGIGYTDTYGAIVQRARKGNVDVINLAYSGKTSSDFASQSFSKTYVSNGSVNYLVIQLGIVDCAPRLLTFVERAIGHVCGKYAISAKVFNYYIKWKSKHRMFFTKWFPMTQVNIEDFSLNIKKIIDDFTNKNDIEKIFLINIAYPGENLISKSWGILDNIIAYNEVLTSIGSTRSDRTHLVDLFSKTNANRNWITEDDGHHVVSDAHAWLASDILNHLPNN